MPQRTNRRRLLPGSDQVAMRALIPLGAVLSVAAALAAGAHVRWWELVALVVASGAAVLVPDSSAPTLLLFGQAALWLQAPGTLSAWVLVASAGLVLAHVTALVAALGPASMPVDRGAVRRWAARGALVWAAGVPVWALAAVAQHVPHQRSAFVAGVVVLIVLAAVAANRISREAV